MKKFLKKIILPLLLVVMSFSVATFYAAPVSALTLKEGAEAARCEECPENLFGNDGVFRQITSTIIYIVGVVAVIMLVWGGLRYVLSGGDSKKVTDAKNTILYAIIGLIVSFLAYAAVIFVIESLPHSSEDKDKPAAEETSLVLDATNC